LVSVDRQLALSLRKKVTVIFKKKIVDTKNQLADISTKPLTKDSFYTIRKELGLLDASDLDKCFMF